MDKERVLKFIARDHLPKCPTHQNTQFSALSSDTDSAKAARLGAGEARGTKSSAKTPANASKPSSYPSPEGKRWRVQTRAPLTPALSAHQGFTEEQEEWLGLLQLGNGSPKQDLVHNYNPYIN